MRTKAADWSDGQLHEVFQGPAAGLTNVVNGCPFIALQPPQWAIEVDVGGMNELEGHLPELCPPWSVQQ